MVTTILNEFDTIAAISTPSGEGALHIVRMSGDKALDIIDRVYYLGDKKLSSQSSHTIHYGYIKDYKNDQIIDEVMVTIMLAPKTYTKEDVVEINCHGGIVIVNKILQLLLREGARLAEPGEFTKRAFLNGRIDLSQAEAVIDLINAKTINSASVAINQLQGSLANKIKQTRQVLFDTLGEVEVNIDYPEYDDVEQVTSDLLRERIKEVKIDIEHLLDTAEQGKILREGLATAIIGRPNVGKSSLLNELIQEDKAIVTDIAGTTRDVIEEYVNVQGVPLKLIDTAGIRQTEDVVEQIGVQKSLDAIINADFILLLLNQSEHLTDEDKELLEKTKDKDRLILLNKGDLDNKLSESEYQNYLNPEEKAYVISAKEGMGISIIGDQLAERYFGGKFSEAQTPVISNARHINLLEKAIEDLSDAENALEMDLPVDLVQMDVRRAWEDLGNIIGESTQDELLDQLFSQFCLGK